MNSAKYPQDLYYTLFLLEIPLYFETDVEDDFSYSRYRPDHESLAHDFEVQNKWTAAVQV